VVICLERGADWHMAQLMPLPLTVSCFSKIQIGSTFLVPAHLGSPGKGLLNGCVFVRCHNKDIQSVSQSVSQGFLVLRVSVTDWHLRQAQANEAR